MREEVLKFADPKGCRPAPLTFKRERAVPGPNVEHRLSAQI